jgi:dihydrodipicolinate synthase/N-acetylneuraminate lyase
MSNKPLSPGIYVPAVLFFKEDEELDEDAIRSHVLRLVQVPKLEIYFLLSAASWGL